ncbi:MAG: hypothetical protein HY590_00145 [Candidatus Omnitrophica bacterium]|nr:hypothetical protein [Candidatus Omnitrophota bacterium]
MKDKELVDVLILMGGLSFAVGILLKVAGQEVLFSPLVYWRFAMGCLALSIALSLKKLSEKK